MEQDLQIKGMVCSRCITAIKNGITSLRLPVRDISLGKIRFTSELSQDDHERLEKFLLELGFETLVSRNSRLVNQVKNLVDSYLADQHEYGNRQKFSVTLSETLHMNYDSISEIFSTSEGITLEKYMILKRIEKVKELLVYSDKSLTRISQMLGYSSINHLSRQFKEVIGCAPSFYRKIKNEKEKVSDAAIL